MADLTKEELQRLVREELVRRELERRKQAAAQQQAASTQGLVTIGPEEDLGPNGWQPAQQPDQDSGLGLTDLLMGRTTPRVSKAEAVVRGIAQGATLGYGDQIAGVLGAVMPKAEPTPTEYDAPEMNGPDPALLDNYRRYRDYAAEDNRTAQTDRPGEYFAGNAGGGLATAFLPGAAAAGWTGLLKSAPLYGAALGLGESGADLTRGEYAQAAKDTLTGAGVSTAGGALLMGAGKGLGAGVNWLLDAKDPVRRLARETVAEAQKVTAKSATGKTGAEFADESKKLEEFVSGLAGTKAELSPGQHYGSKAALGAERAASQMPEIADEMIAQQAKRVEVYGKALQTQINNIAENPAALGDIDTGARVGKTMKAYFGGKKTALQNVVRPKFEEGYALLDPIPAPTETAVEFIKKEMGQLPANSGGARTQLQNTLDALTTDGSPVTTFKKMRAELSDWTARAKNRGTVIEGMVDANARRIAAGIAKGLQESLDRMEQYGSGRGVELVREAKAIYRKGMDEIESESTETVRRILKLEKGGSPDKIIAELRKRQPSELAGVRRILKEADPGSLQQLQANYLQNMTGKAGLVAKGEGVDVAEGMAGAFSPYNFYKQVTKAERGRLNALFFDQPETVKAINMLAKYGERLSQGPGVIGSDTAPKLWYADAMRQALKGGVSSSTITGLLREMAEKKVFSSERAAEAIADPAKAGPFVAAMDALTHPNPMWAATKDGARKVVQSVSRLLSVMGAVDETSSTRLADSPLPKDTVANFGGHPQE